MEEYTKCTSLVRGTSWVINIRGLESVIPHMVSSKIPSDPKLHKLNRETINMCFAPSNELR